MLPSLRGKGCVFEFENVKPLYLYLCCLCILATQPRKSNAEANSVDDFVEALGPAVLEQKSRL